MHPFGPEDIVATAEALGISMTDKKILVESFLMAQNRAKSLDFEGVYRTDIDGTISFYSDGNNISVIQNLR